MARATDTLVLDHRGDVVIDLRVQPNANSTTDLQDDRVADPKPEPLAADAKPNSVRYLVSSRHLCLASPVFRAMMEGPWLETPGTSSEPHRIMAVEWDPDALLIVLRVIHGQHRSVPRRVTIAQLREIALIVDYYKCHEAVEVFGSFWVPAIEKGCPMTSAEGALLYFFIASVFREKQLFEKATTAILSYGKGPLDTGRLPIAPALVESLDQKRLEIMDSLVKGVNMLQKQLYDGGVCKQSSYNVDASDRVTCDAAFLAFLLRQTWTAGLGKEPPSEPYHGYGAWELMNTLSNLEDPPKMHRNAYSPSACSFASRNKSTISNAKKIMEDHTLGFDGQWRRK